MKCIFCFAIVHSLNHVWLFVTPWMAACQASLSLSVSQSLLKLMSIESVMLCNHLNLCHSLLLLPSIFPNIRVFSNESALHIRWLKYWSFSFSVSPSMNIQGGFPLGLTGFVSMRSKGLWGVFSSTSLKASILKHSVTWSSTNQGKWPGKDSSITAVRRNQLCWNLDVGFLASKTSRKLISVA